MRGAVVLAVLTAASMTALAPGASAQDVELWARLHETAVPEGYTRLIERRPDAFRLRRGFRSETRNPELDPHAVGPARIQGNGGLPFTGRVRIPVLPGMYADLTAPEIGRAELQREFFDGPSSRNQTVSEYYANASGGLFEVAGDVQEWLPSTLTGLEVTGEAAGVGDDSRVADWFIELLAGMEARDFDWGPYDNDGPDGIPNSGDDDGFVDVVALLSPLAGGECNPRKDTIWSHRWHLGGWGRDPFITSTASANGGNIRVDDYFVSGSLHCSGFGLNFIGTFTHELAHAFGLPDLYGVGGQHPGTGFWDLMGFGSAGCSGENRGVPCDLSAWSKAFLGWVDVEEIPEGEDLELTVPPVEVSRTVYRVDAVDGSGDFFLLENRTGVGSDRRLHDTGLLVWRIDATLLGETLVANRVNSDPDRMGVWLQQADGGNHLARSQFGAGDSGDPFPGEFGNRSYHAASSPSALTHTGAAAGVTLLDIRKQDPLRFDSPIRLRLVTGYRPTTLRVTGVDGPTDGLIELDGQPVSDGYVFWRAPFEGSTLSAEWAVEVGAEERNGFRAWSDGEERERVYPGPLDPVEMTASYGRREVRFDLTVDGVLPEVSPGEVEMSPASEDGWITADEDVRLRAVPRTGFAFAEWGGALEGQPNPAVIRPAAPIAGTASFESSFTVLVPGESVTLEAAETRVIRFDVSNANFPLGLTVSEGRLPAGMTLNAEGLEISGAPLETGTFELQVLAQDNLGLVAEATVRLEVSPPDVTIPDLVGVFRPGGARTMDSTLRAFLDYNGNRDGVYDLGDFRAFVKLYDVPRGPVGGGR